MGSARAYVIALKQGWAKAPAFVRKELPFVVANYVWMATLGPMVAVLHVLVAGFFVGALVTATHQSEELYGNDGERRGFIHAQFTSTREAVCQLGPLERWIWGGMDTQLMHHLFPSMPRYHYHKLRPL